MELENENRVVADRAHTQAVMSQKCLKQQDGKQHEEDKEKQQDEKQHEEDKNIFHRMMIKQSWAIHLLFLTVNQIDDNQLSRTFLFWKKGSYWPFLN